MRVVINVVAKSDLVENTSAAKLAVLTLTTSVRWFVESY